MEIKYIGKTNNHLKHNNKYTVLFTKPNNSYVYYAKILYNITDRVEMDAVLTYASQISIKQNWKVDDIGIDSF